MIRKATIDDLARIAEIQIFNYRLSFYPIFKVTGEKKLEDGTSEYLVMMRR